MIVLDTNVVSALMRDPVEFKVVEWLDRQDTSAIFLSAISLQELRYGVLRLPAGRRRSELNEKLQLVLEEILPGRIVPFDREAAEATSRLQAAREARGRTVEPPDAQIAGIAIARRASICTRNVRYFEDAGVPVVNPWA